MSSLRSSASSENPAGRSAPGIDRSRLPPLNRDIAFWSVTATQFLGAFNDNLFKQLLLLLAIATTGAQSDRQFLPMLVFALPFVLFSGFAGQVSDRVSKRRVVVLSKVAEIAVMGLGMVAFYAFPVVGLPGLLGVLFLMGTQSAFFGPAKYGILPEMLREVDLPRANGIFLMTTFLAIIFGTATAGVLAERFAGQLWCVSLVCVGIAGLGTATSLLTRRVPAAEPGLRLRPAILSSSAEARRVIRSSRPIWATLLVAALFWMVGGLVQPAVNSLGTLQLQLGEKRTSLLAATIGVGIAIGSLAAGYLSRGKVRWTIVRLGGWGIVANLLLLAMPGPRQGHLLGYEGSFPVLLLLGTFTGMFIVPIQVFLQARAPAAQKGQVIATMNQWTWIGILGSALLYELLNIWVAAAEWPRCTIFLFAAVIMGLVVICFRPGRGSEWALHSESE